MDDRPDLITLERIAARGWQGTCTAHVGDWLLRAGGGFTGRANSVLPLGSAGCDLDAALRQVAEFYARQGLPAKFQVPLDESAPGVDEPGPGLDGSGRALRELDRDLRERGWSVSDPAVVMTAPLTDLLTRCPAHPTLPSALLEPVPSPGWLAGYHYRGRPLPPSAVAVLVNADRPVFASVRLDGITVEAVPLDAVPLRGRVDADEVAGVARGVVADGWLGVTAVTVREQCRRSGIGRQLMGELARWATARGAHSVYLQVDSLNHVAIAMYERLGFTEHHRYHYLTAPVDRAAVRRWIAHRRGF